MVEDQNNIDRVSIYHGKRKVQYSITALLDSRDNCNLSL